MSGGVWFVVCVPTENYERQQQADGAKEVQDELTKDQNEKSLGSKTSSTGTFSTAHSGELTLLENGPEIKITLNDKEGHLSRQDNSKESCLSENKNEKETCHEKAETEYLVDFVEREKSMHKLLEEALLFLGISDAVWVNSRDGKFYQVSFPCESGARCDIVLRTLTARGIGRHENSTVGVVPCAVFYRDDSMEDDELLASSTDSDQESESEASSKSKLENKKSMKGFKALQKDFLKSVTARLTVSQVVEGVRNNAILTFDFTLLIIFASTIAAMGLMDSNPVILVASMLISPLMGPILAGTFGAVVQDRSLWLVGIRTELIGLTLCVIFGFLIGLICANFGDSWGPEPWPTPEMTGRGQLRSLWTGIIIALPSGGGVALSVLGGNVGSLVGVAISASLLPPAVNAGLLWGIAAIKYHLSQMEEATVINGTFQKSSLLPPPNYNMSYSDSMDVECAIMGIISLLLTIINIICIFIAAVIVLKIKEVAPNISIPKTRRFWTHDIKVARDYNKTLSHHEVRRLGKQFLDEWAKINGVEPSEVFNNTRKGRITQLQTLKSIVEDVEADDVYQTVMRYLPVSAPEPLSRQIQLSTWPVPEALSPQGHRTIWELGLDSTVNDVVLENHISQRLSLLTNHIPHDGSKYKFQAKKYLQNKTIGWSFDSMTYQPIESSSEIHFQGKRRHNSSLISTTADSSYSGFLNTNKSGGLWPSQPRLKTRSTRFVVTPVDEVVGVPSPHARPRPGKCLPTSALETVTTV